MAMEQAHTAVSDAERALQSATERLARAAHQAVDTLSEYSGKAEERLRETSQVAGERSQEIVSQVRQYVEDHPMAAIGIAAAVGFTLGMLMRSGGSESRSSEDTYE
jgi:ElaB/YqjD/DUF883 family membrane-anchored ribosome-binding protein